MKEYNNSTDENQTYKFFIFLGIILDSRRDSGISCYYYKTTSVL